MGRVAAVSGPNEDTTDGVDPCRGGDRSSLTIVSAATKASISAACPDCQASTSGSPNLCDLDEHVHALQQDVNMLGLKDKLSLLCRDEAVFHRVRHPHRGIKPDNSRGSL